MYCTCMLYMCNKTQRGREGGRREKGGGREEGERGREGGGRREKGGGRHPRKVPQYILR